MDSIKNGYEYAKAYFAKMGIDVDKAIEICDKTPISVHCWQGDDVIGFEKRSGSLSGGIQATGNYAGRARTADELRADLDFAMRFFPGEKKINIHANYAESEDFVERDELTPEHFEKWADWAVERGYGIDFNPTYFSHPLSENGTLSAKDDSVREFWIRHGIACRKIGGYFAERTGKPCVINHWTPDGDKEFPIDTLSPRLRLKDSYDKIFDATKDVKNVMDGIESKVFGIGLESYTVGSHEFCMGYVLGKRSDHIMLTLDSGHYHPTEVVSAKLGSVYAFQDHCLLHVSRPVRWDSDHVVCYDDELKAIMDELVRLGKLDATYIATDYFDASINRVAAWIIGLRNTRKAILSALLTPVDELKKYEAEGDNTSRLAVSQLYKTAPVGAVWDYYCSIKNAGVGKEWLDEVKKYETEVLANR